MKLVFLPFLLGCTLCLSAQRIPNQKQTDSALNAHKTGDDKSVINHIFGAFADVVGSDGSTILLQPTIYSIGSLFNPGWKVDSNYARLKVARSIQLNLGATANPKNLFKYDSARLGLTIALINNKELKQSDYDALRQSAEYRDYQAIYTDITSYAAANSGVDEGKYAVAMSYLNSGFTANDILQMPSDLKTTLRQHLRAADDQSLAKRVNAFSDLYDRKIKALAKKTALTIDFASIYDFTNKDWGALSFQPLNFYYYLFKKWDKSPAINLKFAYQASRDTLTKQALKRRSVESDLGINWVVKKTAKDEPVIEIKPGVTYTHISKVLYAKENRNQWDPTTTFRFRLNKDFYLPIKLVYDTEGKGELLGFLSIQFSLK